MSERDIRAALALVFKDLDDGARRMCRDGLRKVVLPAFLGVGLAVSPGCLDRDNDRGSDGGSDTLYPPGPEYGFWDFADERGPEPVYGVPMEDAGDEEILAPSPTAYGVPMEDAGNEVLPPPAEEYGGPPPG